MTEVQGLKYFAERLSNHRDKYVVIGGSALVLELGNADLQARTTKDMDLVLLFADTIDPGFAMELKAFISDGGYEVSNGSTDKISYYRFNRPKSEECPSQIELFSRRPAALELMEGQRVIPIDVDASHASLSAILLDDDYYRVVVENQKEIGGLNIVDAKGLIILKMKAHLDLKARKESGEEVSDREIRKHRNDVLRLTQLLSPTHRVALPASMARDIDAFLEVLSTELSQHLLDDLQLKGMSRDLVLEVVRKVYL